LLRVQKVQDQDNERFQDEPPGKEEAGRRVEELLKNPQRDYPGRRKFLSATAAQPGIPIPPSTYSDCSKIQMSGAAATRFRQNHFFKFE
jgi:hypothetical protein